MLPKLSFILGGAASGKSAYAEALFTSQKAERIYLATAQSFDKEMENKIARHRVMRGDGWKTIEEPTEISPIIRNIATGEALLLDCATLWLSNLLLAGADIAAAQKTLLVALAECRGSVVVVSNEVGAGIVPKAALSRRFREDQGRLNQAMAAQADFAALIVAGLPLVLKGTPPEVHS